MIPTSVFFLNTHKFKPLCRLKQRKITARFVVPILVKNQANKTKIGRIFQLITGYSRANSMMQINFVQHCIKKIKMCEAWEVISAVELLHTALFPAQDSYLKKRTKLALDRFLATKWQVKGIGFSWSVTKAKMKTYNNRFLIQVLPVPPHAIQGWEEDGWERGCVVLSYQMGLNHDNIKCIYQKRYSMTFGRKRNHL